jgi:hypothetical protein
MFDMARRAFLSADVDEKEDTLPTEAFLAETPTVEPPDLPETPETSIDAGMLFTDVVAHRAAAEVILVDSL